MEKIKIYIYGVLVEYIIIKLNKQIIPYLFYLILFFWIKDC